LLLRRFSVSPPIVRRLHVRLSRNTALSLAPVPAGSHRELGEAETLAGFRRMMQRIAADMPARRSGDWSRPVEHRPGAVSQ